MTALDCYKLLAQTYSLREETTLREINETLIPKLAKQLDIEGGYHDIFIALIEEIASGLEIDPFEIQTDCNLLEKIFSVYPAASKDASPYLELIPALEESYQKQISQKL